MTEGRDLERGGRPLDEHLGDDVVGLVLGNVDGDERARMAAHVLRCSTCRREYDELATTVEDLLPAVPGVQPPIGFDERVLATLAADASAGARGPRRRWMWLAGAAAALALLVVSLAVVLVTSGSDEEAPTAGEVATLHLTKDGAPVGTVSISDVDGRSVMVVALLDAPDDVAYYCRTTFADGTSVDSETWPSGNGAWVVPLPDASHGAVSHVEVLPDGTEHVWSAATFT